VDQIKALAEKDQLHVPSLVHKVWSAL
jgi:hypothetical protein